MKYRNLLIFFSALVLGSSCYGYTIMLDGRIEKGRYISPHGQFSIAVPDIKQGSFVEDKYHPYPEDYGGLVITDENGKVIRYEVCPIPEEGEAKFQAFSPDEKSEFLTTLYSGAFKPLLISLCPDMQTVCEETIIQEKEVTRFVMVKGKLGPLKDRETNDFCMGYRGMLFCVIRNKIVAICTNRLTGSLIIDSEKVKKQMIQELTKLKQAFHSERFNVG